MRLLIAVAVAGALLLPSTAQAKTPTQAPSCYCVWFVSTYVRPDTNYYRAHMASRMKGLGLNRDRRDEVKTTLYDWSKRNSFDEAFCKRHKKACKAAAACIAAAAASVGKDLASNSANDDPGKDKSAQEIAIDAGNMCAAAAAAVWLTA